MERVRRVLIVGGGSSGWMTAAFLKKALRDTIELTLIEAQDIPIIGVGESTNGVMRHFQRMLGLDEKSTLRESNGAFKVAIRFENFNRVGGVFYHPFGKSDRPEESTFFTPDAERAYEGYHLAERGNVITEPCSFCAYQIDAGLYGHYLKQHSKKWGVGHILDTITRVDRTESGEIACVQTEKSGPLTADLYIDCSGFRSILLGKALGEPFVSVNKYLLNDRAIAARVPYVDKERELQTYTNCTGLSAGWVWNIPLWSRIGTGYVYSSAFLSASEAEDEYRRHLGGPRAKDLAFNHIEIRSGRHDRAWVKNCVAIGISHGFLEPLESTGLSLAQVAIMELAGALWRGATSTAKHLFNRRVTEMFDVTRDFIVAHYVLTRRDDTPYWSYIRNENPLPDRLVEILDYARKRRFDPLDAPASSFYQKVNWNVILAGMGHFDGFDPAPGKRGKAAKPAPRRTSRTTHARVLAKRIYDGDYVEPAPSGNTEDLTTSPRWHPTW